MKKDANLPRHIHGLDCSKERLQTAHDLVLSTLKHHVITVVPDIRRRTADEPRLFQLNANRRGPKELGHRRT